MEPAINFKQTKLSAINSKRLTKIKSFLDFGLVSQSVILAGGSLRTLVDQAEPIVDYDLFFVRGTDGKTMGDNVQGTRTKLEELGFKCTYKCPENKLFTYVKLINTPDKNDVFTEMKVQLVCEKQYVNPVDCLQTFDVSPCLFAMDNDHLYWRMKSVKDVKRKTMDLTNLEYPVATMRRIMKYATKGYKTGDILEQFVRTLKEQQFKEEALFRKYID